MWEILVEVLLDYFKSHLATVRAMHTIFLVMVLANSSTVLQPKGLGMLKMFRWELSEIYPMRILCLNRLELVDVCNLDVLLAVTAILYVYLIQFIIRIIRYCRQRHLL